MVWIFLLLIYKDLIRNFDTLNIFFSFLFLIVLHRLYPVDKSRLDDGNQEELEAVDKKTK